MTYWSDCDSVHDSSALAQSWSTNRIRFLCFKEATQQPSAWATDIIKLPMWNQSRTASLQHPMHTLSTSHSFYIHRSHRRGYSFWEQLSSHPNIYVCHNSYCRHEVLDWLNNVLELTCLMRSVLLKVKKWVFSLLACAIICEVVKENIHVGIMPSMMRDIFFATSNQIAQLSAKENALLAPDQVCASWANSLPLDPNI